MGCSCRFVVWVAGLWLVFDLVWLSLPWMGLPGCVSCVLLVSLIGLVLIDCRLFAGLLDFGVVVLLVFA